MNDPQSCEEGPLNSVRWIEEPPREFLERLKQLVRIRPIHESRALALDPYQTAIPVETRSLVDHRLRKGRLENDEPILRLTGIRGVCDALNALPRLIAK